MHTTLQTIQRRIPEAQLGEEGGGGKGREESMSGDFRPRSDHAFAPCSGELAG